MKRKQSTASASNKKRKKGDDNSPTKANWWSDRIEAIREHVVVPSTHTVDDTPLSWASRNEFHDDRFYEFVQVDTARNVVKKKDRKHTTGMSKKKLAPDEVIRSRKIRVRPTRRQKRIFHDHWANTARYLYNETLDLAQEQGYTGSKQVLRNVLLDPELNPKADECEFVFYTHKKWKKENGKPPANARILNRDGKTRAIFSFFDAREASKEGLKAKRTKGEKCPKNPTMKRKTRDDMNKSIQIDVNGGKPSVTWTSEGFLFWKDSGFGVLRVCEGTGKRRHKGGLIKQVKRTGNRKGREIRRLTALNGGSRETHTRVTFKYERPGRYYMIIPVVVKKQPVCEEAREIIAFDPGIRTFQTGYDNRGRVVEYGASKEETTKGGVAQLYKLGRRIDKLWSLNDTTKKDRYENKKEREQYKNRRRKLRRRIGELSYRITNLKRDLHWKMAREITSCYDDVLMPVFRVKEMIGKEGRRINKETVKKMLHWSHYEFREHLKHKAEERGTVVHMVTEHYSSKTCGACGHVHWKLGSNKTFQCPSCQFTIDRDHNGARNIFLMNIERFVGRIRIPSGLGAGPIVTTSSDGF